MKSYALTVEDARRLYRALPNPNAYLWAKHGRLVKVTIRPARRDEPSTCLPSQYWGDNEYSNYFNVEPPSSQPTKPVEEGYRIERKSPQPLRVKRITELHG